MRTNLRRDIRPLIGRADELESLDALFDASSLVTVVGAGGLGKTRLAREFGAQFDADEVWFVDLSSAGAGPEEASALTLGTSLADEDLEAIQGRGQVLLILDGAERLLDEVVTFAGWLLAASQTVRILVTSRASLNIAAEHLLALQPLSLEASVELFESQAERCDGDVEGLAKTLEGNPLAIELAASRTNILGLQALNERLQTDIAVLKSRSRDLAERHRSFEATLDGSWDLLTSAEQRALEGLSVFPGEFDLEAAEAVLDAELDAVDALEALVECSLLNARRDDEGMRFEMPHLSRLYARSKVAADAPVWRRHAEYFASRSTPVRPRDVENLYAAARRVEDPLLVARLVRAAEYTAKIGAGFARYRDLAHGMLDRFPDAPPEARALLLRARALANLGMRRLRSARIDSQEAVELARSTGEDAVLADSLPTLAMTLLEGGEVEEATVLLEEAVTLSARGHLGAEVVARQKLGIVRFVSGDLESAERELRASLRLAENIGEAYEAARTLSTLAMFKKETGLLDEARRLFEKAIERSESHNDAVTSALTHINLGDLLASMEREEEAIPHYERALEWARTSGDRLRQSAALLGLVGAQPSTATNAMLGEWLREAGECLENIDAYAERARAWLTYATFSLENRHFGDALDGFSKAADALDILGHNWLLGLIAAYRAIALAAAGDEGSARHALATARDYWSTEETAPIRQDFELFEGIVNALGSGEAVDPERWRARAATIASDPRLRTPMWVQHNHVRAALRVHSVLLGVRPTIVISVDGRTIKGPEGEEHDFSRRGPLRLILLRLADARRSNPGECLTTEDLIDAAYPGEVMTFESGRTRIYAAIRRLRKLGLERVIETRDEGYLIPTSIDVVRG